MTASHVDIAIVGAGMAGLTCAQLLHQAGYQIALIDKSRGLGGRLATRRLHGTHADHGVCYLKPKDPTFKALLDRLLERKVLRVWTDTIHELDLNDQIQAPSDRSPRYACDNGISAIAKFLAIGLPIRLSHRVETIARIDHGWQLQFDQNLEPLTATALVIAIPAPQAAQLVQSVNQPLFEQIKTVEFTPCISAIAVYPSERQREIDAMKVQAIVASQDADLGWIGIDSTKQINPAQPVFVIQSNATFAARYLEAPDLQAVGEQLLSKAAHIVAPWLTTPEVLQVHRWRYAFAKNPVARSFLTADTPAPLVCTGDWCGGNRVESAFLAGLATAQHLNDRLERRSLRAQFWSAIS